MSSDSKYIVSAKEYLKIGQLMLCGKIVTEVLIPHNLVHVVVQDRFSSCLSESLLPAIVELFSTITVNLAALTGTEFTSKCANCSNHIMQ